MSEAPQAPRAAADQPAAPSGPGAGVSTRGGAAVAHHALDADRVLASLGSDARGLSSDEARRRLEQYGANAIETTPPASAWQILLAQLRSVVVLLLVGAGAVSIVVGDVLEAAAIAAVLLINTALGFTIEFRARRAMEALMRLEVARAMVVRDGVAREVDARTLVPGDVIEIDAGRRVPADARILEAADLRADEAPLTGESLPVDKRPDAVDPDTPLPDRTDMLYMGTTVVAGTGRAVVVATGMATELGRIGRLVGSVEDRSTPLEQRLDVLGRRLVWLALAVGVLVALLGSLRGVPWREVVQTGLALAVAAVPEGLPAVATVALALAVSRMARQHALVRRLPSVETLGAVTVICTDKTGTLTTGQPTVTLVATAERELAVTGAGYAPDGELRDGDRVVSPDDDPVLATALRVALLANHAYLRRERDEWIAEGDPTEAALIVLGAKVGLTRDQLLQREPLAGEVPFASERMWMATFHRAGDDGRMVAYVKGAPGRVLDACTRLLTSRGVEPLDPERAAALRERNRELAARGLRVLALATTEATSTGEDALRELTFVALVGMTDPIADGVLDTVAAFHGAGIRTLMITGDQRLTAAAIGAQLGIVDAQHEVLEGREIAALGDDELVERVHGAGAVSRISPEDKLRIVAACQARGDVVAMLGDGVNDAAALRRADVGVAMGRRGTDVAKEAADVVLEDDRFATIAPAIAEGRAVFDNLRKFVFYLFSCNLAEVLVLLIGASAGLELPLLPLQILWLNLITDTFPALALAIEPPDPGIMRRPPRDPKEELLSRRFLRDVTVAALGIAVATLVAFVLGRSGDDGSAARAVTMSFSTLALAQAFHLGNARSKVRVLVPQRALANPWAVAAVLLVVALQVAAVQFEPLALVLRTTPLDLTDWLTVLALAGLPAAIGQLAKPPPGARPRHAAAAAA